MHLPQATINYKLFIRLYATFTLIDYPRINFGIFTFLLPLVLILQQKSTGNVLDRMSLHPGYLVCIVLIGQYYISRLKRSATWALYCRALMSCVAYAITSTSFFADSRFYGGSHCNFLSFRILCSLNYAKCGYKREHSVCWTDNFAKVAMCCNDTAAGIPLSTYWNINSVFGITRENYISDGARRKIVLSSYESGFLLGTMVL